MNKAEFRKAYFDGCRALNLGIGEVLVAADGAMLMHGLVEDVYNVEVGINGFEFDRLWDTMSGEQRCYFSIGNSPVGRSISITNKMEVYRMSPKSMYRWQLIDGVTCCTLQDTWDLQIRKDSLSGVGNQTKLVKLEQAVSKLPVPDTLVVPFIREVYPTPDFDRVYYSSKPRLMNKPLFNTYPFFRSHAFKLGEQGNTFRIHQKNSKLPYPHGLILLLGIVSFGTIRVFGKSIVDGTLMRFDKPGVNEAIEIVSVAEMAELLKHYTTFKFEESKGT